MSSEPKSIKFANSLHEIMYNFSKMITSDPEAYADMFPITGTSFEIGGEDYGNQRFTVSLQPVQEASDSVKLNAQTVISAFLRGDYDVVRNFCEGDCCELNRESLWLWRVRGCMNQNDLLSIHKIFIANTRNTLYEVVQQMLPRHPDPEEWPGWMLRDFAERGVVNRSTYRVKKSGIPRTL